MRDLKIIEGTSGLFVAMPSRKLTDHCPKCGGKNYLRAKFCNDCGARLPDNRAPDEEAQGKLHADVAHPINSECRNRMQQVILDAYRENEDWAAYAASFLPLLEERGAEGVGREIVGRYRAPCLLCSEPAADHCHRRLVAEYWAKHVPGLTVVHL